MTHPIIQQVARERRIPVREIVGKVRMRHIVEARREAMRRMRAETRMSLPQIARWFGADHTTVAYACGLTSDSPHPRVGQ